MLTRAASHATRLSGAGLRRCISSVSDTLAKHVAQYNDDGYTILRNVLDPDLVREMSNHVDFLQRRFPGIPTEHLHHVIMRNDAFWVRVTSDPRLLAIGSSFAPFLARGIALFSSHYFVKQPRTGMKVLWHQDGAYWPLKPMDVMTLWVAVDASTKANGCLRVVKGSHRTPLQELKADVSVRNVLGSATHADGDIDPSLIVDLELAPGDVSVHHPAIVHGSEANTSATRRCGLTIRYISPATECLDKEQPVMMMQGDPVPGVNSYRSWPRYRAGYDLPFAGSETWNSKRRIVPEDEAYFARTDYAVMDREIRDALTAFIAKLGG